jgi:hypothetical protein
MLPAKPLWFSDTCTKSLLGHNPANESHAGRHLSERSVHESWTAIVNARAVGRIKGSALKK